jgi:autotransporter-associated beta strand protein
VPTYYLGGGGGTLQINSVLADYQAPQEPRPRDTNLEMGTTQGLLPGRIALKPTVAGHDADNTYTGVTQICAGTLQLLNAGAVAKTLYVSLGTYDPGHEGLLAKGLFAHPNANDPSWKGPGMLLVDPTASGGMNLDMYRTFYTDDLADALALDGGAIGWTGNVTLTKVPGIYGYTRKSDLVDPGRPQPVNVLGLGGEYSAGVMTSRFRITDNNEELHPVLLYKAGKNSVLDLRQTPAPGNSYTGGTIIAGGEIRINDSSQLSAGSPAQHGGPIAILNGGLLRVTAGGQNTDVFVPVMINTDGTPDTTRNCGSVIEVDAGAAANLRARFDFQWNPGAYLEKTGGGTLSYVPGAPGSPNASNAWGIKLTGGTFATNQMPVNPGADSGPVIFNGGDLRVRATDPAALAGNPAYGFRNVVSFQNTSSTVTVEDGGLFRVHGSAPSEIMGMVRFEGAGDADPSNNIVHLSRNMSPAGAAPPGAASRGSGGLTLRGVTVYMTDDAGGQLGCLPAEAGFRLYLQDGVVFHATHSNNVNGAVCFDNSDNTNPAKFVRINGAAAAADRGAPLTPDAWTIGGTGLTSWKGTTEKIGDGTVAFLRDAGAPVSIDEVGAKLVITSGVLSAGGTADPFTDTSDAAKHVNIENNAVLSILAGAKAIGTLDGTGATTVSAGASLSAEYIFQDSLSLLGAGARVVIRPAGVPGGGQEPAGLNGDGPNQVPEPGALVELLLGGALLWGYAWRKKRRIPDGRH